ncbi:MAG: FAD-dependent oxidoreductase, partial [Myxococcota bacterium]
MEEATFLTRFASKVTVIHRRDSLRASKVMADRAFKNPKIEFLWNHTVVEVLGDKPEKPGAPGGLTGLKLQNTQTNALSEFPCDGFFVAIGHKPNTELFESKLELHDTGYIKVVPGTSRTSVEGVFACGDVQDSVYRQAVTAAGTGCMAAIDAERWLEANEG